MMELRFAAGSIEKPVVGVIIGSTDGWRRSEVYNQISFYYLRIIILIQNRL